MQILTVHTMTRGTIIHITFAVCRQLDSKDIPESFCAATTITPDRASIYKQERRDFCDGAKLPRADLESRELHIAVAIVGKEHVTKP